MVHSANSYHIPIVKLWKGMSQKLDVIEDIMSLVQNEKGIEGCVLRFDDGDMYKVKTQWYFSQSKSMLALPSSERELWVLVICNLSLSIASDFRSEIG